MTKSTLKKKKKKLASGLENADPTKLTASERVRLKKKKKKKKAVAVDDEDVVDNGPYFDTDESDEDAELDAPIQGLRDEDSEDEEDDEEPRQRIKKKKKKLKGDKDKKVKRSVHADTDNEDTIPDVSRSNRQSVQGRTSTGNDSYSSGTSPNKNAKSLLPSPSSSSPSSVDALLAQFAPRQRSGSAPLEVTTTAPATPTTPMASAPAPSPAAATQAPVQSPSTGAVAVSAPSNAPPAHSQPLPAAPQAVIAGSVASAMAARTYSHLPPEERVAKLAAEGLSNEQIAMRIGMSIRAVMDLRKKSSTKSLIGDPRKLFAERLGDFDHDFQVIRRLFHDDPGSEIYYRAMVDFSKTMRELVKEYNDLEDPKETAMAIANSTLRPFVMKIIKSVVDNVNSALKSVAPYLRENERKLLSDNLRLGMKTMQDVVNNDYNNAVDALESMFGVDLTEIKVTNAKPPEVGDPEPTKEVQNVTYQSQAIP